MSEDLFYLKDSIIVVTGGLGQLGRQYTADLLSFGCRVASIDVVTLDDRPEKDHFVDFRGRFVSIKADVTNRESIEKALKVIANLWGIPHGLVNNAAIDSPPDAPISENGPFENYPVGSWDKILDVNLKGPFLCSQVFGGCMAEAGRGSIVNISSIYGMVSPDQRIYNYRVQGLGNFFKPVTYSVSKSGLLNLTKYLATYWAKQNVRVNTLSLGGVFNDQDEPFLEGYCARVPMGRMARLDEYSGALIFLLSRASSYMTGANLVIDGGWTAW